MSAARNTQREKLLAYLKAHSPARARDLQGAGVSATAIARAVAEGEVIRIGRGLYQLPDTEPDTHAALAEIARRAPRAVICLVSALSFHGLTDQIPRKVWIAIGAKDWEPRIDNPPVRVVRFSEPYHSGGIETHDIGGTRVRMYSVQKSLADAFRNRKLLDRSVAIECLRATLESRKATPGEIAQAARQYGAWNQMKPYLEALTSHG